MSVASRNSNNTGTVVLANAANSFTRPLNITQGTVSVGSIADGSVASHAGAGTEIWLGINNSNGILEYTGAGNSTDRQVRLGQQTGNATQNPNRTGAGTIANNGTGGLVFTNSAFNIVQASQTAAEVGPRTLTLGGSYDGTAGNNVIQGVIVDNTPTDAFVDETVGITVAGSVWELQGANTYTGPTLVQSGATLLVNGSTAAGSTVTVDAGGTLGGTGSIGGATTISGTHSPGNSPGIITHDADLTYPYAGAPNVIWELVDNTIGVRGTDFDGIDVNGNLNFAGATTLTLDFTTATGVEWNNPFWDSSYLGTNGWLVYSVTSGTLSNFSNLSLVTEDWVDGSGTSTSTPTWPEAVSVCFKMVTTSI